MSRFSARGSAVALALAAAVFGGEHVANAQTASIGANFTGSSILDSGFIPPDTMGAIGPNQFVELLNGRYAVYDRTGSLQTSSSLDAFWQGAGVSPSSFSFDPRVLFDPGSQRWFAVSADNAAHANHFLVAVSQSANPLDGWTGFSINSDPVAGTHWADFPTVGLNGDGLYVSANMFPVNAGSFAVNVLAIPKGSLLAGTTTGYKVLSGVQSSTGASVQPVMDTANGSLPLTLVARSGDSIVRSHLSGPFTSPGISYDTSTSLASSGFPAPAHQPGSNDNIDTGDGRLSTSIVQRNGVLWGVAGISGGAGAALRWFKLDATTNAVLQQGVISGPSLDYYYGSIAVNDNGDAVIGFTGSGDSQYASAYAVVGSTSGGVTTFGDPMLLKQGVAPYYQDFGTGENRWGDYSATTLDPSDPNHFWTIQEWASGTNLWSTQITEIVVPEPATSGLLALAGLGLLLRRPARRPA